jgi:hypothetical protein
MTDLKPESAEQALQEHLAAARANATAAEGHHTHYSGSVTDFRTQLVKSAGHWDKVQQPYFQQWMDECEARRAGLDPEKVPAAVHDAQSAALMASGYAYTLAAVLGLAEREFGIKVAVRLAAVADDILMNGDGEALNADVDGHEPVSGEASGE